MQLYAVFFPKIVFRDTLLLLTILWKIFTYVSHSNYRFSNPLLLFKSNFLLSVQGEIASQKFATGNGIVNLNFMKETFCCPPNQTYRKDSLSAFPSHNKYCKQKVTLGTHMEIIS